MFYFRWFTFLRNLYIGVVRIKLSDEILAVFIIFISCECDLYYFTRLNYREYQLHLKSFKSR